MSDCNHDCASCGVSCDERQENPGIQKAPMNDLSDVRKVIGIVSGKGGVGKSSVTSMLAVAARKQGKNVAVLDADITGPSIPKAFGIKEMCIRDSGRCGRIAGDDFPRCRYASAAGRHGYQRASVPNYISTDLRRPAYHACHDCEPRHQLLYTVNYKRSLYCNCIFNDI